ncbi:MAG: thioredoxin family protein [candidate division WOR-3 bacterium]|nr:MAG: thioredoxin family protein [candidate division WOR-3 bacterium]
MNRLSIIALTAVLLIAALSGCPGPEPAGTTKPDTTLAVENEICETLPGADSTRPAIDESAVPKPEPQPEPKPEPGPEPQPEPKPEPGPEQEPKSEPEPLPETKTLPRMWDYGSEKCIPCKEMEKILTPMMSEYEGRVDIRIINVYEEQEATRQARIQIIPTQIFYDQEGKELYRHIGVFPRDSIVAKFREFGWE